MNKRKLALCILWKTKVKHAAVHAQVYYSGVTFAGSATFQFCLCLLWIFIEKIVDNEFCQKNTAIFFKGMLEIKCFCQMTLQMRTDITKTHCLRFLMKLTYIHTLIKKNVQGKSRKNNIGGRELFEIWWDKGKNVCRFPCLAVKSLQLVQQFVMSPFKIKIYMPCRSSSVSKYSFIQL